MDFIKKFKFLVISVTVVVTIWLGAFLLLPNITGFITTVILIILLSKYEGYNKSKNNQPKIQESYFYKFIGNFLRSLRKTCFKEFEVISIENCYKDDKKESYTIKLLAKSNIEPFDDNFIFKLLELNFNNNKSDILTSTDAELISKNIIFVDNILYIDFDINFKGGNLCI